ncbi:hypothetical protein ACJ41O_008694 [Fusarium nematophilum]
MQRAIHNSESAEYRNSELYSHNDLAETLRGLKGSRRLNRLARDIRHSSLNELSGFLAPSTRLSTIQKIELAAFGCEILLLRGLADLSDEDKVFINEERRQLLRLARKPPRAGDWRYEAFLDALGADSGPVEVLWKGQLLSSLTEVQLAAQLE